MPLMIVVLVALIFCLISPLIATLLIFSVLLNVVNRSVLYWLDPTVARNATAGERIIQSIGMGIHDALRVNNGRAAILFTMALTCTFFLPFIVLQRPSLSALTADQIERMQMQQPSRPESLVNMLLYGDAKKRVDPSALRSQYEPKPAFYLNWSWWTTFFFLWIFFPIYGTFAMREEIAHMWQSAHRRIHRQHREGHAAPGESWLAQLIARRAAPATTTTSATGTTGIASAVSKLAPQVGEGAQVLFWAVVADFVIKFFPHLFRSHHVA